MTTEERSSFDRVMRNLNREVRQIQGRTMKGLIRAVIVVRRDMDRTSPLIPVDTGNLRQSWFVVTSKGTVQKGQSPDFRGEKAGQMSSQHASNIGNMAALAQGRGSKNKPIVIMGFSANYAVFVHENEGATFQRPDAGAKFFEASLNRNHRQILEIIEQEATVR